MTEKTPQERARLKVSPEDRPKDIGEVRSIKGAIFGLLFLVIFAGAAGVIFLNTDLFKKEAATSWDRVAAVSFGGREGSSAIDYRAVLPTGRHRIVAFGSKCQRMLPT